jgi:hypothetical protein
MTDGDDNPKKSKSWEVPWCAMCAVGHSASRENSEDRCPVLEAVTGAMVVVK